MKAKRKWLIAGGAAVVALGGAMAIPFFIDEPPPDDADLLPRRIEVPWNENGFTAFDVQPDEVYLPARDEEGKVNVPGALDLASGERWDLEIVRGILERNSDVLRKIEECLARPRLQLPMTDGYRTPPGSRRPWLPVADLLLIRARSCMSQGKHQDAALDVEKAIRLGRRLRTSGGLFVPYLIGVGIEANGLKALRDLAESPGVDPAILAPLARELASAPGMDATREMLKTQYVIFSSNIGRILTDPDLSAYLWDTPAIWYDAHFLKPNASRQLLAKKVRTLLRNLELPLLERTDIRLEALEAGFIRRWIPRPNALGRAAVHAHLVGLDRSVAETADLDLRRTFVATLIALKCWKARHGALPPSLDALVPEYLDAVPRDPYDGKPLRYSAQKRTLYSVGGDGIDSGGLRSADDEAALEDGKEPTLRL